MTTNYHPISYTKQKRSEVNHTHQCVDKLETAMKGAQSGYAYSKPYMLWLISFTRNACYVNGNHGNDKMSPFPCVLVSLSLSSSVDSPVPNVAQTDSTTGA